MRHFFRPLNGIQYLTLGLVVVMAAGFIYGFSQIQAARKTQNAGLRIFICSFEHAALHPKDKSQTPRDGQRTYIVRFFDGVLERINVPLCAP